MVDELIVADRLELVKDDRERPGGPRCSRSRGRGGCQNLVTKRIPQGCGKFNVKKRDSDFVTRRGRLPRFVNRCKYSMLWHGIMGRQRPRYLYALPHVL